MKILKLPSGGRKRVAPFAYEMIGEWLYFCDLNLPGLFRYHFEKEICECVIHFSNKYINKNFFKMHVYEDELWLLPFLDGALVCFNIQTKEIFYYDIPENVRENRIPFIGMFFSEKKGFILPHGNNSFLIKVDLVTHQMEEIELFNVKDENNMVFFSEAVQIKNIIYLFEGSENTIFLFDMNNNEIRTINAEGHQLKNREVGVIGNKIFFFPWDINANLVIYDICKKVFFEKEYPIKGLPKEEECAVVLVNKEIWILANKKKKIYQLDQDLKIKSIFSILDFNKNEKIAYISGRVVEDRAFFYGHDGTPLIQIKDGDVKIIDINKNVLELFIEIVNHTCDVCYGKLEGLEIGKLTYENLKGNTASL